MTYTFEYQSLHKNASRAISSEKKKKKKKVLRDAWGPQYLQRDAWLNPNYPGDAGPDFKTGCYKRVIYQTYFLNFRDKRTLFDLWGNKQLE